MQLGVYNSENLQNIYEINRLLKQGKTIVTEYDNEFGLPSLKANGLSSIGYGSNRRLPDDSCYLTEATSISRYSTFFVTANEGKEIPEVLLLDEIRPLDVTLDEQRRLAWADVGDEKFVFKDINPEISGWGLARELAKELPTGYFVKSIRKIESAPIFHLFKDGDIQTINNGHAVAKLVGSASDTNGNIVYVSMVAHISAVDAIKATLAQSKPLSVGRYGKCPIGNKWEYIPTYLEESGDTHLCCISRLALPDKWAPEDEDGYILFYYGQNIEEIKMAMIFEKFRECMPFAVEDNWGEKIISKALKTGLLDELDCTGDCIGGYRIRLKEKEWLGLLNNMLKNCEIEIGRR